MASDSESVAPLRRRRRLAATVALALLPTSSTFTLPRHQGPPRRLPLVAIAAPDAPPTSTSPASHSGGGGQLDQASSRLYRARLRLAEAQGRIPPGVADEAAAVKAAAVEGRVEEGDDTAASTRTMPVNLDVDDVDVMLRDLVESNIEVSRIREYNFTRVAQAEYEYDPSAAEARLFRQPLRWLKRNVELGWKMGGFVASVVLDIQQGVEPQRRRQRAQELERIIASLGPAIIKGGQALASRPDLLPEEYLEELQRLQDRLPTFPKEEAFAQVKAELGVDFDSVFELIEPEPIAAASIGQVFKARLISNGNVVAIKIQRPRCEEIIAVDLYIMRFYAGILARVASALGRNIDLVSVIDDFGELIYREIDYTAEAANARRFAELYATIPDVFIPRIYPDLCSNGVLTMEWVEGVRLVETEKLKEMQLDPEKLVDTLVQCSLRQMLENGFFHADPHAGNLLATPEGKLCYLDFGMMSYVEANQRYSIIEAVVHLVNRDFNALANLYKRMEFIPPDEDVEPLVMALEGALPDVLDASVSELNFKNVINKLGGIMYEFPFSLPPYYIAIIRCLGVLEGLALQVDDDFRIISDAYPYIASRLLTDPSPELQSALQQLLFKEGRARWERLLQLLERAKETRDYDVTDAVDKLLDYLVSPGGAVIRDQLVFDIIEGADELSAEALEILVSALAQGTVPTQDDIISPTQSPRLATASRLLTAAASSRGFEFEKVTPLLQRLGNEPAAVQAGVDIAAAVSERAVSRVIRTVFALPGAAPSRPGAGAAAGHVQTTGVAADV